jgi:hypothetical protein
MSDDVKMPAPPGTSPPKSELSPEEAAKKTKSELREAIGGSESILTKATSIFPFTFFPDTVIVDRTKLTITRRQFFQVAEVMSIAIDDILNVTANVGPFFGSLKVTHRLVSMDEPYCIKWLWREDALRVKRILHGYIIAHERNIDCTPLKTKELAEMLNKLGQDEHAPKT